MMPKHAQSRPEMLDHGPLRYAPQNELGVVFLFAHLARKWRLKIDLIRPGYPDCIAFQKIDGAEKEIRIEFEYKSRNFAAHRHLARKCDWLVCWEHNWPSAPPGLHIVELRREFGLGFNVWIQPVTGEYKEQLSSINYDDRWSAPSRAHKGDLLLFYHTSPDKCIKDIFVLTGSVLYQKAGWKAGKDYMGPIKRVAKLHTPVFLEDIRRHRIVGSSNFARCQMGRPNVTACWPYLHEMILQRNSAVRKKLEKYDPAKLS